MTRRQRRDVFTVAKDIMTFAVGLGLIIRQGWFVGPSDFNLAVLLFGGVMVNVPGVSAAWALRTALQQSPRQEGEASHSSPSSSSSAP